MRDPAAPAARTHDPDYYQRDRVALAMRIASRHGVRLFSTDASALAASDPEFRAVWRNGDGEAEAEEILARALEVADIHQP